MELQPELRRFIAREGNWGMPVNVEAIFSEWTSRCRQLARRAKLDAERAAELAHINPDATLPLAQKEPSPPPVRRKS